MKQSKKIVLSVLLSLLCVVSAIGLAACDDDKEEATPPELRFELSADGKAYALAGLGTVKDANVTVPATYKDLPVTAIKSEAFRNVTAETKLILPDSIGQIADKAFFDFKGLKEIELPANLTQIGNEAFSGCEKLTSITLPATLTQIGEGAFYKCSALTAITLPTNITAVGKNTFAHCTSLASVNTEHLGSIGERAFSGCALTAVTLPAGIRSVGVAAFGACKQLTRIVVPADAANVDDNAFENCDAVTEATAPGAVIGNILRFSSDTEKTEVTVTSGTIPETAFMGCKVGHIVIGEGVTTIENSAFAFCETTSITFQSTEGWTVKLPDSDTEEAINVTDPAQNAVYLTDKDSYRNYIWTHA